MRILVKRKFGIVRRRTALGAVVRLGAPWLPLALRWRVRSRTRVVQRGVSRAAALVPGQVWAPGFHLHFSRQAVGAASRERFHSHVATKTIHTVERRDHSVYRDSRESVRWLAAPRVGVAAVSQASLASGVTARGAAGRASNGSPLVWAAQSPRVFRRSTGSAPGGRTTPFAPLMPKVAAVAARPAMQRFRGVAVAAPVSAAAREEMVRQKTMFEHQHDLVWRKEARPLPAGAVPAGAAEAIVDAPTGGSRVLPRAAAEAVAPQQTFPQAAAAAPVTKLDPALMDRLAEDVIRRVERRVRIERERRGL